MTRSSFFGPYKVLIGGDLHGPADRLEAAFPKDRHAVYRTYTGRVTLDEAGDIQPHVILIDMKLPDMAGHDVCRALLTEHHVSATTPILLVTPVAPNDGQRLEAIIAGARECVGPWTGPAALHRLVEAYARAKVETDRGLSEGLVEMGTGLYNERGLLRRAHELGAHAARGREGLACLVIALEVDRADDDPVTHALLRRCGQAVRQAGRMCDVVGRPKPNQVAVLAPATGAEGVLRLAHRVAASVRSAAAEMGEPVKVRVSAGYDAVPNLGYMPLDPVTMLVRATAALHNGRVEPSASWIRRF